MSGAHHVTQNDQKKVTSAAPMRIDVWCSRTHCNDSCGLSAGDGGGTMCISQPKPTTVIKTRANPVHTKIRINMGSIRKEASHPVCGDCVSAVVGCCVIDPVISSADNSCCLVLTNEDGLLLVDG